MNSTRRSFPGETVASLLSLPSLGLYIFSLILGIVLISFTPIGRDLAASYSVQHIGFFFLSFPIPLILDRLSPTLASLVVYAFCITVAWKRKPKYHDCIRQAFSGLRLNGRIPNWLVTMPIVTSTLLVIVLLIAWFQDSLGAPTGALPNDPAYLIFAGLTTSPISEEFTFRITSLGLLVALRTFSSASSLTRGRIIIESFIFPESAKEKVGLTTVARVGWRRGLHWSEWLMLLVSSAIFGLAHISSGSTWELGKLTTATLSGFVIGIAFIVYGVYASILLHWFFNYFTQVASIPLAGPDSIATTSPFYQPLTLISNLVIGWTYFIGIIGILLIGWLFLGKSGGRSQAGTTTLNL